MRAVERDVHGVEDTYLAALPVTAALRAPSPTLGGTKLQRNGALFGSGIYLSTSYDTAFSFCEPRAAWARSRFGTKLRVLLVCEVDLDRATRSRWVWVSRCGLAVPLVCKVGLDRDTRSTWVWVSRCGLAVPLLLLCQVDT